MLNFFIGFAFFEFGALCGFFVAALMQTAMQTPIFPFSTSSIMRE